MVSIIIPVYNAEKYIKQCIDNIMLQEVDKEILLINDGSTDSTKDVCDQLASEIECLKVIHTENKGVSHARNMGIENATGEYISFVDVDDLPAPNMLQVLLDDLQQNDCDMSCIGYTEVYVESQKEVVKAGSHRIYTWDDPLQEFLTDNKISWMVWGKLLRRDIIGDIRFPVGKAIAEDMYFVYQICKKANRVIYRDESYYRYMIHEQSAMGQAISEKNFDVPKLIDRVREETMQDRPDKKVEAETFQLRYYIWFYRFIVKKADKDTRFETQIEEIRKGICRYKVGFAWKTQTKKYLLEYLLIKNCKKIYLSIVQRS